MQEIIETVGKRIPRYFMDLLDVSTAPKRFIAKQYIDEANSINDAFVFLGITLLVTFAVQLPLLQALLPDKLLIACASLTALTGLGLIISLI